jgi:hypothetical protein
MMFAGRGGKKKSEVTAIATALLDSVVIGLVYTFGISNPSRRSRATSDAA